MQAAQQAKSSATQPGAPIKVLHLGYGARGGGVGRALSDVACEMQRRGFECSVIFFGVYPAFSGYMDPLKASDIPTYDLVKTPGLDLRGVRAIGTIVRLALRLGCATELFERLVEADHDSLPGRLVARGGEACLG